MKFGQWIGLLALVIALYILWAIRNVLLLVFTAVVIATSLNQLARQFQRWGIQRSYAVLLCVLILITFFVGLFFTIVPAFAHEFQELSDLLPKGLASLNRRVDQFRDGLPPQLIPYFPDVDSVVEQFQPFANLLVGRSVAFFSSSLGMVLNFLLVLVLSLMFLADPQSYRQGFILLSPSFYRRRVDEILTLCEEALGRWIVGALAGMCVIALLSGIGLRVLQVRASVANGVLAGVLNLIPNFGPAFSVIPPMAIALLDAPWKPLAVFALYFGIQQFESNFLTPYIMAQQVALLPAFTLLAQVFFATFFGFLGLLLSLPLTVVGQVWVREVLIKDILDPWKVAIKDASEPSSSTLSTIHLVADPIFEEQAMIQAELSPSDETDTPRPAPSQS
ncbi:MAG: AI-2E family transporter [Leptolyngbyaceae bacterium]|nr:AI-2E family transporter [Leptolyngbyaceae bacterium]